MSSPEPADGGYHPRTRVRVRLPRDPHTREVGRVERTYNDGGDMVHVVRFADGSTAEYGFGELAALTAE
ncbi:hypothetical protein PUR22_07590 [Mycolicibacterium porcinum]|uniref:hypothetical protein n=1 Tax=Mycolicibacterium porcinum TaxID=39693 RepID=UPI0031F75811